MAPLVLCYHAVSDGWEQALAVRPHAFERQLKSLLQRRYRPVSAADALDGSGRLLHITFDDAFRNIETVLPMLQRLRAPATIFVATQFAAHGRPLDVPELADEAVAHPDHLATMDWEHLRDVVRRGFEVGSHTVTHPHLTCQSDAELERELVDSRRRCEDELGRPCRLLAYPYGEHDQRVRAAARRAGYAAAFSLHVGEPSGDRYAVPRVDFYRRDSLARATLKTSPARRAGHVVAARLRRRPAAPAGVHPGGWLPAVLPERASRISVADPVLAGALSDIGTELDRDGADAELATLRELRGSAGRAVVSLDSGPQDSGSRSVRVARRVANAGAVRLRAARARQAMTRLGYDHVDVVLWDYGQTLRVNGNATAQRRVVDHLAQRALVIGTRGPRPASMLDAAVSDASRATGLDLSHGARSIRTGGVILIVTDEAVMRAAAGPGCRQILAQLESLRLLHGSHPPPAVAERVAVPLAEGRTRSVDWSVEQRLPGAAPGRLGERLLGRCVDFLVSLHSLRGGGPGPGPRDWAAVVATHRPAMATALHSVGARLEEILADVPRGFGHGDFFLGNLLEEGQHITGVIDWDAGGPGRLPLLDLIHLRHVAAHPLPDEDWGPSVARHLLPWGRAGGDAVALSYCRRAGFDAGPERLEALALAYWLDRLAYQLRTHPQRAAQPRWLERSIDLVIKAVRSAVTP